MLKTFSQKVFEVVRKIPKGKVLTYREVAKRAGSPRAYRAVGNILSRNCDPTVPCHRVIRSDGEAGGYNGLLKNKRKIDILRKEGVEI
ncbi:MAG: MGMT family protein [bacterium]|nr:MGMT family protein [bacterium]